MINIDANLENADWLRTSWNLPVYKSSDFMKYLEISEITLDSFRKLPLYKNMVKQGKIVNDEWKGK